MGNSLVAPWVERPTIRLDGGKRPAARFEDVPEQAVAEGRMLLDSIARELPPKLRGLAPLIRLRTMNRFHAETVALARRVGADWRDLLLANCSYELVLSMLGCSTMALPTPAGPVVARNMDWPGETVLARSSYLIRTERDGRLQFASAGWPGAVGVVTGLSGRGFAIVLNAVLAPEGLDRMGYPVLLHVRRVLEDARDFRDALDRLSTQRLAAAALFTLVGTGNDERVVIERTPRQHALRWSDGDAPLITTNDYRVLFRPQTHAGMELYETTCRRYDALSRFLAGHDATLPVADEQLLYLLSDPAVMQEITAQHIILRPRDRQMRLFVPRKLLEGRNDEGRKPNA